MAVLRDLFGKGALILVLTVPMPGMAASTGQGDDDPGSRIPDTVVEAYQRHRQAFRDAVREMSETLEGTTVAASALVPAQRLQALEERRRRVRALRTELASRRERLEAPLEALRKESTALRMRMEALEKALDDRARAAERSRARLEALRAARSLLLWMLFPFLGLGVWVMDRPTVFAGAEIALGAVFAVWLINVAVLLWYRLQGGRLRVMWWAVPLVAFWAGLMAFPAWGAASGMDATLDEKLQQVAGVLSVAEPQRLLALLEARDRAVVELPDLEVKDPDLRLPSRVRLGTAAYGLTLAALYAEMGRDEEALAALDGLADADLSTLPEPRVAGVVRYLVRNGRPDTAQRILRRALPGMQDVELLAGLAEWLDAAAVDELADAVAKRALATAHTLGERLRVAKVLQSRGDREGAARLLGAAVAQARTPGELLRVARVAHTLDQPSSTTRALERAVSQATAVEPLLRVHEVALALGDAERAQAALDKAAELVTDTREAAMVAEAAHEAGLDSPFQRLGHRAGSGLEADELLDLAAEWRSRGWSGRVNALLDGMIRAVGPATAQGVDRLLAIAAFAVRQGLIERAAGALERAALLGGSRVLGMAVAVPPALEQAEGLPDPERVTLRLYYGMLNERLDRRDRAARLYAEEVEETLARVLEPPYEVLPRDLNAFHLLGRLWMDAGETDRLARLDQVYTELEKAAVRTLTRRRRAEAQRRGREAALARISAQEEALEREERRLREEYAGLEQAVQEEIAAAEAELAGLREAVQRRQGEFAAASRDERSERVKAAVRTMRLSGQIVFLAAVMLGCLAWAWFGYARRLGPLRIPGLAAKWVETQGWVSALSVVGALQGVVLAVLARLALDAVERARRSIGVQRPGPTVRRLQRSVDLP